MNKASKTKPCGNGLSHDDNDDKQHFFSNYKSGSSSSREESFISGGNEVSVLVSNLAMTSRETNNGLTATTSNDGNENINTQARKMPILYQMRRGAEVAARKSRQGCGRYWSTACSVKTLKQKLPILTWLPNYRITTLKSDLIAGLTVGLTVIPQGMAYAALAGLELQYGLYSAFMGCFIYCLMGTSKDITMGPTAIMSILVAEYAHDPWSHHEVDTEETTNVTLAVLLTFSCGIIQILMSIFKLGFLVRYISHPVITGFMSAAAIVISMTQFKKIMGIPTPRGFIPTIYTIFRDIKQTKIFDLILGLICMIFLFVVKYTKQRWSTSNLGDKICKKIFRKCLWFFGTARNAIVVVISAIIAYCITDIEIPKHERPLTLTQNITGGIPPFMVPQFSYDVRGENRTIEFEELLQRLGSGLAIVPLIGFLESIAIAKAFGRKNNYKVDASQELLASGVSNFFSAFVSSYTITGSFGRSAVNAQSNVMTPAGGIVTGAIVLVALEFFSNTFQYIPVSALAAVIIMAVINLFDWSGIMHIWHVNKLDILPLLITFFLCFYDIAYGIMAGIGVSIIILLASHARPLSKAQKIGRVTTISIEQGLDFPGADHIEERLQAEAEKDGCEVVIVDCSNLTNIDYTAAEAIYHGAESLKNSNIVLKLCGLSKKKEEILKRKNITKYDAKFYDNLEEAVLETIPSTADKVP